MKNPVVSVIMGVRYRRDDINLLSRSVASILKQSITDLEILICDDGSSSEASSFLEYLSRLDQRVRLIRKEGCLTLSSKLNLCLQQARGSWIGRMDDDDYSHPQRLERQLAYLEEHHDISLAGCCVNLRQTDRITGVRRLPEFPQIKDFYFTQPFIHPTLLFQRKMIEAAGGYSEDKYCDLCEDYDLLLRLYAKGFRGANLQEVLFDYTIPNTAKGNRRFRHRVNESVTRYHRFRDLKILPSALPYVIKPLAVGLIPERVLKRLKESSL